MDSNVHQLDLLNSGSFVPESDQSCAFCVLFLSYFACFDMYC